MSAMTPTLQTIREAHARIGPHIHRTPVLSSTILNGQVGAMLYFKCENFQKVGAFKARGACNAVLSLTDEQARRGVVTHSSGNHGAALAWAARLRGVKATVVVPDNAPPPKKRAIAAYGADIVFCAPNVVAREAAVAALIEKHGYFLIHPFDNDQVIAGQGTATLELLEQKPDLDMVISRSARSKANSSVAESVKRSKRGGVGAGVAGAGGATTTVGVGAAEAGSGVIRVTGIGATRLLKAKVNPSVAMLVLGRSKPKLLLPRKLCARRTSACMPIRSVKENWKPRPAFT